MKKKNYQKKAAVVLISLMVSMSQTALPVFAENVVVEVDSQNNMDFSEDNSEEIFIEPECIESEELSVEEDLSSSEEFCSSDQTVVFDADELETFKNRTFQDVVDQYSVARLAGETYQNDNRSSWYDIASSTVSPYEAGRITEDTHKAMTAMTNFYRWLVGVEPLKNVSQHSDSLQAQALVRNFEFNHFVSSSSKPADMSDELWNFGAPCNHNILARGYTPRGAITGWMNEGYSLYSNTWDTVGHRYAIIGGSLSDIQFGYSGYIAIGAENSFQNRMTEPFAAFPAPGYMPENLIYPRQSAWSIQLNTSMVFVPDSSGVEVKVTNLSTGKSYSCTEGNGLAQVGSSSVIFVQPSDFSGSYYTDSYRVEISGLQDKASGVSAKIQYTTQFVDITNDVSSYVADVAYDINKYVIYQSMSEKESLKKVAAILPQEVRIKAESGMTFEVPVKGEWKIDEKNSCFYNSADTNDLPGNLSDKKHLLDRIDIKYVISDDYYDSYNSLSIDPGEVKEGDTVRFYVYRTDTTTDKSQIFQLNSEENGTYTAVKKYDSSLSSEFDAKESEESIYSAYHIYKKTSVTQDDAGEYISVYFDSDYEEWGPTDVYVSTSTDTLKVSHVYDNGKITKAATCTNSGIKTYTCTKCGAKKEEQISAVNHNWDNWTVVSSATYAKEGSQTRKCKNCSKVERKVIPRKVPSSLQTPKSLSAKAMSYNQIKISWGKVPYADGYKIYRKTSGKKWEALKSVSAGTLSYIDTKAVTGTKYSYTVRAYWQSETKTVWSGYNNNGISMTASLGRPSVGTLKTSSKHVTDVTWKKVSGATGYQVYCKTTKSGKYVKVKTTTGTSFAHTKRKQGTVYYYKVRAYRKVSANPNRYVYGSFSDEKSVRSK